MQNLSLQTFYDWPIKTRIAICCGVGILAFILGYYWDLASLRANINVAREEENNLKVQFELLITKQEKLKNELQQLPHLQSLLNAWQKKIINYQEMPEILNEILKLGANNNLYFTLFTPGEDVKEDSYYKLPIRMITVGSYHQLADFLSQITNMDKIIVIESFNINNENKNDVLGVKLAELANTQNLLTAAINLEIYHLPNEKQLLQEAEEMAKKKAQAGSKQKNGG